MEENININIFYIYKTIIWLYTWNQHNIVNQLYFNKKNKKRVHTQVSRRRYVRMLTYMLIHVVTFQNLLDGLGLPTPVQYLLLISTLLAQINFFLAF